jgi:uncharacterized protein YndB with AHSA1/START domain
MNDKISKEQFFSHPMNRVWEAISQSKEISTWFLKADFEAREGYEYTFKSEDGANCTTINGKVLTANPINELVYTWLVEGTEVITTVSWKLEEKDGGTLLKLEHWGISNFPGESAVAMFNNFEGGWVNCLEGLENHLTKVNV